MLGNLVTFIFLFAGGVAIILVLHRYRRNARSDLIRDRLDLNEQELWQEFYRDTQISEAEFRCAWRFTCELAKLDPRKLRPSDRIRMFAEHNAAWNMDDEWDDVLFELKARAERCGIGVDWDGLNRVDDVLRLAIRCQLAENNSRE